ncbi:MAG TPA: SpoIIE family protein phosphatase [Thermoleophilaceae bacterium]|nr:SpoIIE family protein phosphatase [Thermoleophilaceae bacterium]
MDRTTDSPTGHEPEDNRLAVQSAVARALSEATTASDGAQRVLGSIGATLGWRLGAVWEVDPAAHCIRCVESWRAPGAAAPAFEETSRTSAFGRGEGLPGRVWATGEPAWVRDVLVDPNFPRADVAAAAGVHGAFAFPIRSSRGVIGAVEFFTLEVAEPDRYLLDLMTTIGHQLGLQMERTRAEQAVRRSEARKAAMLEASLDCIVTMDHRGRVVEFNAAAEHTFGYAADEVVGREMAALIIPPALRESHREGLRRYLETGERNVLGRRLEITGMRADGAEFPVELTITRIELDGPPLFTGFIRDISARKRREQHDRFLAEAGALLGASLDVDETLAAVTRLAVPGIADWCAIDLLEEDGAIRRVAAAHADPVRSDLAFELSARWPSRIEDEGGFGRVIRTGEPEFLEEIPAEAIGALEPEYRATVEALGLRSVVIVPLRSPEGRSVGALALVTAESGRTLDEHDVVLGLELGRRCGVAIDNARLYRERSDIAQTLQRSLLPPELPEIPGVAVAACFRPAGHGIEMGGDFYDVFALADGSWALTIGDVCGKGPSAAALTALARYTLRAVTMHDQSPDRVLELLNEAILRNGTDGRFCSAAFARLVPTEEGVRAEIASGGHPPPLLVRADGAVEEIGGTGLLLGLWPDPKVTSVPLELGPGDALVLYTDGVTDARAPELILAPDDMAELLRGSAGCPAPEIARRVERAVTEGAAHEPRDDIALLVIGVESRVRTTRRDDRSVQIALGSRADAPLLARRAIEELAGALPQETVEELKLLATEMVTNSVKHAGHGGAIGLELRLGDEVVLLAVTDSGEGFEPRAASPDPESEAGRGLFIVEALADRWGVDAGAGTRVWAELDVVVAEPATRPPAQLPRRS